mmetsp:Transcript_1869/g.4278  ORF Transcript_1869/g.4278 Transcript_1869/m.4278 type:complete len:371 (-) Transcript_1869:1175-2287(-)
MSRRWRGSPLFRKSSESILAEGGPATDEDDQHHEREQGEPKSFMKTMLAQAERLGSLTKFSTDRANTANHQVRRNIKNKQQRRSEPRIYAAQFLPASSYSTSSEISDGVRTHYSSTAADADDEYSSSVTEDEGDSSDLLPQDPSFDLGKLKRVSEQFQLRPRELHQLWELFKKLDKDNSGTIDKSEMFDWLGQPYNMFTRRLFDLVDAPRKGHLDFVAFIKVLCTYALFGNVDILKFCFFALDSNANGCIDHNELHQLAALLHSDEDNQLYNIDLVLQHFDKNMDGVINFDEFRDINRRYPYLLYPAFRLQSQIESKTLGRGWWKRHRRKLVKQRGESFRQAPSSALQVSTLILKTTMSRVYAQWVKFIN